MGAGPGPSCQSQADKLRVHRVQMSQREAESTGHRLDCDTLGSPSVSGNTEMEAGRQRGGGGLDPETPTVITFPSPVTNLTHTGGTSVS